MNHLSHTIRTFNRFELKYLISIEQAARIKSALRPYLVPDENGSGGGRYSLSSLYYDSPGLHFYSEKQNGLLFRRKLRIRYYDSEDAFTNETPVFVEIKQRLDRVTQKRRARLSYEQALRLCNDRKLPDVDEEDKALLEEVYVLLWQYNLQPASIVRYDRLALIGTRYDLGLRVTFDTSLSFVDNPLHLHDRKPGLPMLPTGWVVMEIKVNDRMPRWLVEIVARHNLNSQRISKYCRSIDAARSMPSAAWRRRLPESSQRVLSSALTVFSSIRKDNQVHQRA
jgi:SPX domain protein involved in polyphosphate accumulation